jgi:hypothetical protein
MHIYVRIVNLSSLHLTSRHREVVSRLCIRTLLDQVTWYAGKWSSWRILVSPDDGIEAYAVIFLNQKHSQLVTCGRPPPYSVTNTSSCCHRSSVKVGMSVMPLEIAPHNGGRSCVGWGAVGIIRTNGQNVVLLGLNHVVHVVTTVL